MSNIGLYDTSSVPIRGKIYICEECKKEVRIEFQGGTRVADVGEYVLRALGLSNKRKLPEEYQQPNKYPWRDGFYLFGFALCKDCFEKGDYKRKNESESEVVENVITDLKESRKAVLEEVGILAMKKFKYLVEGLTGKKIHSFIGKPSEADVGDKHLKENKKKRLLRAYVRKNIDFIERNFFKTIWAQMKDSDIVQNYQKKRREVLPVLKGGREWFAVTSTDSPVICGGVSYLDAIMRARVPEENSIVEDFYYLEGCGINGSAEKIIINNYFLTEAIPKKDRRNLIYSKVEKELLPLLLKNKQEQP